MQPRPLSFRSVLLVVALVGVLVTPNAHAGQAGPVITTVAGGLPRDVPADSVALTPAGLAVAEDGTLFAADASNGFVWAITPDGRASVIAGTGLPCSLAFSYYEAPPECRGRTVGEDVPATSVPLQDPAGLALGPDGGLYFTETRAHVVRRIDLSTGRLTTYAGDGERGYDPADEGALATHASLHQPQGLAFDSKGTLYIADHGNQRIRKVTADGRMHTVAGCGQQRFPECFSSPSHGAPVYGTALTYPVAVAVDEGGRLFVEVRGGLFWVDQADEVYVHVGGLPFRYPSYPSEGEGGPASDALFDHITALAFHDGALYVADSWWNRIRSVDAPVSRDSIVRHVAGCYCGQGDQWDRHNGFNGDGRPAKQTAFALARATRGEGAITFDAAGNLYVADVYNHRIRRIHAETGLVSTVAGNGEATSHTRIYVPLEIQPGVAQGGHSNDGVPADRAMLFAPSDVEVAPDGSVLWLDRYTQRVRRLAPDGAITTIAGAACPRWTCNRRAALGDGGPARAAVFDGATHIALDASGTQLYVGDTYHHRVRQVNLGRDPVVVYPGGPAPITIAPGAIATVFGDGTQCYARDPRCQTDGTATTVNSALIQGVAVDKNGNLYVADASAHNVRRVDASTGVVTMVVGGPGGQNTPGCVGNPTEGAPGRTTLLCGPTDLAVSNGRLYIVETGVGFTVTRSRVREVDVTVPTYPSRIIAGNGTAAFSGDGGPGRDAALAAPHGVAVADDGSVYIADTANSRIRKVTRDGTISTVAGSGEYLGGADWLQPGLLDGCGLSGDAGPAEEAQLCGPTGVALTRDGTLYIADQVNNRIRAVSMSK